MEDKQLLKILIISPTYQDAVPLETNGEVHAIARAFRVELVDGHVSIDDVYRAVSGHSYDVIHIAAHGTPDGIRLSNGILDAEALALIARKVHARLVYFNACTTVQLAQFLANNGVPVVIAAAGEIGDVEAWTMAGYFYDELARNGLNFRAAYDMVKPKNGLLVWLSNGHYVENVLEPLNQRLEQMQANIEAMLVHDMRVNRTLTAIVAAGFILYVIVIAQMLY